MLFPIVLLVLAKSAPLLLPPASEPPLESDPLVEIPEKANEINTPIPEPYTETEIELAHQMNNLMKKFNTLDNILGIVVDDQTRKFKEMTEKIESNNIYTLTTTLDGDVKRALQDFEKRMVEVESDNIYVQTPTLEGEIDMALLTGPAMLLEGIQKLEKRMVDVETNSEIDTKNIFIKLDDMEKKEIKELNLRADNTDQTIARIFRRLDDMEKESAEESTDEDSNYLYLAELIEEEEYKALDLKIRADETDSILDVVLEKLRELLNPPSPKQDSIKSNSEVGDHDLSFPFYLEALVWKEQSKREEMETRLDDLYRIVEVFLQQKGYDQI
jgi:hypothetical protein